MVEVGGAYKFEVGKFVDVEITDYRQEALVGKII